MDGVGVDKGNLQAEQADAREVSINSTPSAARLVERDMDVVDLVREVVHAGAAPGEEAPDGGVVADRREQLDPAVADEQGRGLEPWSGHLAVLERGAEEPLVRPTASSRSGDSDADVVDPAGLHAGDAMPSPGAGRREDLVDEAVLDRLGRAS